MASSAVAIPQLDNHHFANIYATNSNEYVSVSVSDDRTEDVDRSLFPKGTDVGGEEEQEDCDPANNVPTGQRLMTSYMVADKRGRGFKKSGKKMATLTTTTTTTTSTNTTGDAQRHHATG
jgi:hypothetical protein